MTSTFRSASRPPPEDGGPVSSADRWRLALAAIAVLLAAADTYVVVVALPRIMDGVGVSLDRLQRATPIISGFLLGYTAVLPLIGRVADVAGTGPTFAGCMAAFAAGSLVTATAHSLPVVVAGRALQGLGGGGLVPVAMAMVAAHWPADERGRPLGVIGALQELGSVVGPLYGAAIVSVASWRAIFWINVPVVAALSAAFSGASRSRVRTRPGAPPGAGHFDLVGAALLAGATAALVLGLEAPDSLATSPTIGQVYVPRAAGSWAPFTTPVVMAAFALLGAFAAWEVWAPRSVSPLVPLRRLPAVLARCDLPGAALLAAVLACVVVAFSTSDPSRQVVASSAAVLGPAAALAAGAFWWRQRRAAQPLVARGALAARPAWGGLVVNLALGAALMSALVDVPLFARTTAYPDSEVDAALVLLRFLVAVPVGAIAGGILCRERRAAPAVAGAGLALSAAAFVAMAGWSATALGGGVRPSDFELVACGFGFGLAVAPVNVAVLGAVGARSHALASALVVVARTVGMLAGLSALTAVALHRFYQVQSRIPSPLTLCPRTPTACPAYNQATTRAVVAELHAIFTGAAICAGTAAILAVALLRVVRSEAGTATSGASGTTR